MIYEIYLQYQVEIAMSYRVNMGVGTLSRIGIVGQGHCGLKGILSVWELLEELLGEKNLTNDTHQVIFAEDTISSSTLEIQFIFTESP